MNCILSTLTLSALAATLCFSADSGAPPSVASTLDQNVKIAESEIVSLAEAMPADKFDFAPTAGEFKGVRTFAQQLKHVAAVNYLLAAAILEEKSPVETNGEKGPDSLKSKDQIVKFLKDSFVYVHKANASLTDKNLTGLVKAAFGNQKVPRISLATEPAWHTYDHYGQAVVYARMNGIVPPASR